MMFALITVIITVHAFVFYNLYVVNGSTLMSVTGEGTVLGAINKMGGVYMFGRNLPIWAVILTEFCLAYILEVTMGSPCSFKLVCFNFPFALFFIQPLVRTIFKATFAKNR